MSGDFVKNLIDLVNKKQIEKPAPAIKTLPAPPTDSSTSNDPATSQPRTSITDEKPDDALRETMSSSDALKSDAASAQPNGTEHAESHSSDETQTVPDTSKFSTTQPTSNDAPSSAGTTPTITSRTDESEESK